MGAKLLLPNSSGFSEFYGLEAFQITSIDPNPTSKIAMAPIETGAMCIDSKVVMPLTIDVEGLVTQDNFTSVFSALQDLYVSRDLKFCAIVGKVGTWRNLILTDMPHKEESGKYDAVKLTLKFVQLVTDDEDEEPESGDNSDTVSMGRVNGVAA